jgi:hypothetical protein
MKTVLTTIAFLLSFSFLNAQSVQSSKWTVGAFYSFLIDPASEIEPGVFDKITEHYLNIHAKYKIHKRWGIPVETIFSKNKLSSRTNPDNPFFVVGTGVEFDVLPQDRFELNFRLGLSAGNLLFTGDQDLPQKEWVVNRVIGGNFAFKTYRNFWLSLGYYNHFPIGDIPYKYGFALPFLGVEVKL